MIFFSVAHLNTYITLIWITHSWLHERGAVTNHSLLASFALSHLAIQLLLVLIKQLLKRGSGIYLESFGKRMRQHQFRSDYGLGLHSSRWYCFLSRSQFSYMVFPGFVLMRWADYLNPVNITILLSGHYRLCILKEVQPMKYFVEFILPDLCFLKDVQDLDYHNHRQYHWMSIVTSSFWIFA